MMRSSTYGLEYRELLSGVKQWKGIMELASKQLPEIQYTEE